MSNHDSSVLPMLLIAGVKSWEQPELTSLNTLPPHALLIPFPGGLAGTLRRRSRHGSEPERHLGFQAAAAPGSGDAKMRSRQTAGARSRCPATGRCRGSARPTTRTSMPFPQMPPQVPADNPTGVYRRRFGLPESWRGRRIVLHIAGCEGACYVYLKDRPIGLHKDSRTPAEYDVTDVVHLRRPNTLLAVVPRWSDASFVEDQDHWWQSGIHRDVFLYATDSVYLADVCVAASVTDDLSAGILRVRCTLDASGDTPDAGAVEAQLFDPRGCGGLRGTLAGGDRGAGGCLGRASIRAANCRPGGTCGVATPLVGGGAGSLQAGGHHAGPNGPESAPAPSAFARSQSADASCWSTAGRS